MVIRKLSIIVPVFNEEDTVIKALKKIVNLKIHKITTEIILINDGSTDKTLKLVKRFQNKKIKLINKTHNQGKGAAIKSALLKAKGDVMVIQDADMEYDPEEIKKLIIPAESPLIILFFIKRGSVHGLSLCLLTA